MDDAFRILMILSVPVFALVLAALLYSIPRFRRRGVAMEDGPPIHTSGRVVATWFLVTTALTVVYGLGRRGRFTTGNYWGVEGTVKYWHFVDVAWVFIYPTLYLVN